MIIIQLSSQNYGNPESVVQSRRASKGNLLFKVKVIEFR